MQTFLGVCSKTSVQHCIIRIASVSGGGIGETRTTYTNSVDQRKHDNAIDRKLSQMRISKVKLFGVRLISPAEKVHIWKTGKCDTLDNRPVNHSYHQ